MKAKAPPKFSPREGQVLDRVSEGMADKQIADDLGISPETVASYLKRIFRKLGIHTRVLAAVWRKSNGVTRSGGNTKV